MHSQSINKFALPHRLGSSVLVGMGAILADKRAELQLTQQQTADLADMSVRSLKQVEAGQTNIGLQPLLRLLYVLGLELTIDKRHPNESEVR